MKGHNVVHINDTYELDIAHIVNDVDVIRNNIMARCRVLRGELMYNVLLGIPLKASKEDLDLNILNIIHNTEGVLDVAEFNSTLKDHKYSASIRVITVFRPIDIVIQE